MRPVPFSFEIYPPRTEAGAPALYAAVDELVAAGPDFISVTYGASGSTRERSLDLLRHLTRRGDVNAMAHLTCVGADLAEGRERIREISDAGASSFLAIRGDAPEGDDGTAFHGELSTATQLVELIRAELGSTCDPEIAVAAFPNGHPHTASRREDIETLLAKQTAGARSAITQLFFDADDYLDFVADARAAGVTLRILPGIMPVLSLPRLRRMLELSGEREPAALARALELAHDADEAREIGIAACAQLVRDLVAGGAPGIHVYAFNQAAAPLEVLRRAGLLDS